MNQYLPLAIAVVGVVAFYVGMVLMFKRNALKARAMRSLYLPEQDVYDQEARKSLFAVFCQEAVAALGINIASVRKGMYEQLSRAGLQTDSEIAYFMFFRWFIQPILLLIAVVLVLVLFSSDIPPLSMKGLVRLLIAFMLGSIGVGGHQVILDKRTKKRKQNLSRDFPDAMDLLLVCVEAGMPLDAALARVCRELKNSHPIITRELDRTRVELGVYGDRGQTLQNLADRTDIRGFRSLVSALIQTEKYGTNLASTLRVLAEDLRTERLLFAENKAARVPALITIPVILFIFFPFIVLIMAPPLIRLTQQGGWPD